MGAKQNPHRGPSKNGKRVLNIYLTDAEHQALAEAAERAMRSKGQHARWLLTRDNLDIDDE
jgi:hypothetical protein